MEDLKVRHKNGELDILDLLTQVEDIIIILDDNENVRWTNKPKDIIEPFLHFRFNEEFYHLRTWYMVKVYWLDDYGFLIIASDVTDVKRNYNELLITNRLDFMTKAYNKFEIDGIIHFIRENKLESLYGAIMFNIDYYSSIIEELGQDFADDVIKNVSKIAKNYITDIDFIIRYDDDEFLIFKEMINMNDLYEVAKKIQAGIRNYNFEHNSKQIKVTASFGLSNYEPHESYMRSVERAGDALFQSKSEGRDKITVREKKKEIRFI